MSAKGDKISFDKLAADRSTLYVRKMFTRTVEYPLAGCRVTMLPGRTFTSHSGGSYGRIGPLASGSRSRSSTKKSAYVQVITADGDVFTVEAGYHRHMKAVNWVTQVNEWIKRAPSSAGWLTSAS